MRPSDLFLYLFGHRGAIERIASTRHAWLIGAILVLTAGIARNYDHLDLLRQPEWFVGPFVASLVSIVFIFLWISGPLRLHKAGGYRRQVGTFLILAWLTAPCAWLYAIPVESITDIMTATKWNIAFLGIVAFWRVAIIVRAVSVLTELSWVRTLPLVLAPAALEAMLGSFFKGLSLVGIMGGIRLPPETKLLVHAANTTTTVSFFLFITFLIVGFFVKGVAQKPLFRPTAGTSRSLIGTTLLIFLAWAAIAVPWHPQIANRYHLQQLIQQRDLAAAIAFASAKTRLDFPPHHDLPPIPSAWPDYELMEQLPPDAPAWLREAWIRQTIESLKMTQHWQPEEWRNLSKKFPEIPLAIDRYADDLRSRPDSLDRDEARWLRIYETENEDPTPTNDLPPSP